MGISIEEYKRMISRDKGTRGKENPNPNRQFQGKQNREWGKQFEDEVQAICQIYERNKLARIEKTPEPMKVIRYVDAGMFECVFEKSAQPDFKGIIKGGRCVVFDAKFTTSDRIKFQVLSDYQREALLKYHELGAMSFVLVGFANGGIYKIDINDWENMISNFGRKYIKKEELDELKMTAPIKKGINDFLNIL